LSLCWSRVRQPSSRFGPHIDGIRISKGGSVRTECSSTFPLSKINQMQHTSSGDSPHIRLIIYLCTVISQNLATLKSESNSGRLVTHSAPLMITIFNVNASTSNNDRTTRRTADCPIHDCSLRPPTLRRNCAVMRTLVDRKLLSYGQN